MFPIFLTLRSAKSSCTQVTLWFTQCTLGYKPSNHGRVTGELNSKYCCTCLATSREAAWRVDFFFMIQILTKYLWWPFLFSSRVLDRLRWEILTNWVVQEIVGTRGWLIKAKNRILNIVNISLNGTNHADAARIMLWYIDLSETICSDCSSKPPTMTPVSCLLEGARAFLK